MEDVRRALSQDVDLKSHAWIANIIDPSKTTTSTPTTTNSNRPIASSVLRVSLLQLQVRHVNVISDRTAAAGSSIKTILNQDYPIYKLDCCFDFPAADADKNGPEPSLRYHFEICMELHPSATTADDDSTTATTHIIRKVSCSMMSHQDHFEQQTTNNKNSDDGRGVIFHRLNHWLDLMANYVVFDQRRRFPLPTLVTPNHKTNSTVYEIPIRFLKEDEIKPTMNRFQLEWIWDPQSTNQEHLIVVGTTTNRSSTRSTKNQMDQKSLDALVATCGNDIATAIVVLIEHALGEEVAAMIHEPHRYEPTTGRRRGDYEMRCLVKIQRNQEKLRSLGLLRSPNNHNNNKATNQKGPVVKGIKSKSPSGTKKSPATPRLSKNNTTITPSMLKPMCFETVSSRVVEKYAEPDLVVDMPNVPVLQDTTEPLCHPEEAKTKASTTTNTSRVLQNRTSKQSVENQSATVQSSGSLIRVAVDPMMIAGCTRKPVDADPQFLHQESRSTKVPAYTKYHNKAKDPPLRESTDPPTAPEQTLVQALETSRFKKRTWLSASTPSSRSDEERQVNKKAMIVSPMALQRRTNRRMSVLTTIPTTTPLIRQDKYLIPNVTKGNKDPPGQRLL